jgi:uncharacterized protein (TIGR03000 family)
MTRPRFSIGTAGLVLIVFAATTADSFGQWPQGMGFRGPGVGAGVPGVPGGGGAGAYGGISPFLGVYMPGGGYNNGGYGPNPASVPSAAYFTYGNISYTTESPSPIPVYGPRSPYGPLPPSLPLTALLKVQAPLDAEVWLEGHKMRSTGTLRHYRSPPLDPAKGYAYEVRARWRTDDKPIEDIRHVAIRAGATILVDFTHLDPLVPRPSAPAPPPPPTAANPGS